MWLRSQPLQSSQSIELHYALCMGEHLVKTNIDDIQTLLINKNWRDRAILADVSVRTRCDDVDDL